MDEEQDRLIRSAAFAYLERLVMVHGDVLPWNVLRAGFDYQGKTIRMIDYRGIVIPRGMGRTPRGHDLLARPLRRRGRG